jgi:hypothetical protein
MRIEDLFPNYIEQEFFKYGYSYFTVPMKNQFVQYLAEKKNLPYTSITEDYIFNYLKSIRKEFIKAQCEEDILEGFTASNGHVYRTNRDDQTNMIGQKDYLNDHPEVTQVKWKTEDAGYIVHTREEWLGIYLEAFNVKMVKLYKYDALSKQIIQATNEAEVLGITWEDEVEIPQSMPKPEGFVDYVE